MGGCKTIDAAGCVVVFAIYYAANKASNRVCVPSFEIISSAMLLLHKTCGSAGGCFIKNYLYCVGVNTTIFFTHIIKQNNHQRIIIEQHSHHQEKYNIINSRSSNISTSHVNMYISE